MATAAIGAFGLKSRRRRVEASSHSEEAWRGGASGGAPTATGLAAGAAVAPPF